MNKENKQGSGVKSEISPDESKQQLVMRRFCDEKPPINKTVLFVWWHRGGFERSQKTLGFMDSDGNLILDFYPAGGEDPTFWCYLNIEITFI